MRDTHFTGLMFVRDSINENNKVTIVSYSEYQGYGMYYAFLRIVPSDYVLVFQDSEVF